MRRSPSQIIFFSLFLIMLVTYQISFAKPMPRHPINWSCGPKAGIQAGENVEFVFTYSPNKPSVQSLSVRVTTVGDLIVSGPAEWTENFDDSLPQEKLFSVYIPPDDTSGFVFELSVQSESGKWRWTMTKFFISISDTVEIWDGDVRKMIPRSNIERFGTGDTGRVKWQESMGIVYVDSMPPAIPDSLSQGTIVRGSLTRSEILWSKLRRFERTPLENAERQDFEIDGVWYVRFRGETKFNIRESHTTEEWRRIYRARSDSLIAANPGKKYDVVLNLSDSLDFDVVSKLFDSLQPTDNAGFYRTKLTRYDLYKLKELGIEFNNFRTSPPLRRNKENEKSIKKTD